MLPVLAALALAAADTPLPGRMRPTVPAGNPGEWVLPDDYPAGPLRAHVEGMVFFTLKVDATGKPEDCTIRRSSGSDELDATTCKVVLERARFIPALDADGKPTTGMYTNRVKWSIPKDDNDIWGQSLPSAGEATLSFVVMPDGRVMDCRAHGTNMSAQALGYMIGRDCSDHAFPQGYIGADGRPVARRVVVRMHTEVLPLAEGSR